MQRSDSDYVDTNIVIHNLVADKRMGTGAKHYLLKVASGEIQAYSSTHLITEVYAFLKGVGLPERSIIGKIEMILQFGIRLLPLTSGIVTEVPRLMKKGLKYGDSIHYLTMRQHKIYCIITDDKTFDNLEGIKRIDLSKES